MQETIQDAPEVTLPTEWTELANRLQQETQLRIEDEIQNFKDELRDTKEKLSLAQQLIARYKPLIDVVKSHEEESDGEVTIVYSEDDEVKLQSLEEMANYLSEHNNVGSLQDTDRDNKIRILVKYAVEMLVTDTYFRGLFYDFVSDRPFL